MLLHVFLIKLRMNSNLLIFLVYLVISRFNRLWVVCLQLMRMMCNYSWLSLLGPILEPGLVEAVMTVYATIFVEHILRRCLVDNEPIPLFVISLVLVVDTIWVWVILVKWLNDPTVVELLVIFTIGQSLVYYQFLVSLSEVLILLIQIACLVGCLMTTRWSIAGLFRLKFDCMVELRVHLNRLVCKILFIYKSQAL